MIDAIPKIPVCGEMRIDKWLWTVRLFKTRSLATDACREGRVLVGGQTVKPAREVRAGDIITAKAHGVQRTVKVLAAPPHRVSGKQAPEYLEDLTPAAEYEKARTSAPPPQFNWSKGIARPTKKSRRLWEGFQQERS